MPGCPHPQCTAWICSTINWSFRTAHTNREGSDPYLIVWSHLFSTRVNQSAKFYSNATKVTFWLAGSAHWSTALESSAFFVPASHLQFWFLLEPYPLACQSTNGNPTMSQCADELLSIATAAKDWSLSVWHQVILNLCAEHC